MKPLGWLLFFISIFLCPNADAQRKSQAPDSFINKLWFGGSAGLGYNSFRDQNNFLIALFPMAGYKLNEAFSAGPRFGISYRYIKTFGRDGRVQEFHPIELSAALFGRYKIYRNIFGHLEHEWVNEKAVSIDINGDPVILADPDTNLYLGAGYNSGGKFASEIMLLYNLFSESNSIEIPITIRVGFTYNF